MKGKALVVTCAAVLVLLASVVLAEEEGSFKLFPVGVVEKKGDGAASLKIDKRYAKALVGLEDFSHVVVLYWFDKNDTSEKRSILTTRPDRFPGKKEVGVFASRAPVRPNLIAVSVCRILSVKGGTVRVADIDAFDGTPILDLKPYVPGIDCPSGAKLPDWWQPGEGGAKGPIGPGGSGGGPPGEGGFVERVMSFDKDGDGKVSEEEMPGPMKERLLKRADSNGDGALDEEELKAHSGRRGGPGR